MFKKIILLSVTLTSILMSSENNITVYNDNLRFFDEIKNIDMIEKGLGSFVYENVSPNLISDSVSISLPNNVKILEQNYKYDLVNHNNILKYYIDKEISYFNGLNTKDFSTYYEKGQGKSKGTLLSVENSYVVIKEKDTNNIISIPSKSIIVDSLPNGMITKPSLIFKTLSNNEYKNNNINLRYLSSGFSWKSDYVFTIIDKELIANGWITLDNNTDLNLNNYNLKFVSGNLNNVDNNSIEKMRKNVMMAKVSEDSFVETEVKEKSFNGYHIYNIPFKVDIDAKSKKQINFINFKTTEWKKNNVIDIFNGINNNTYKFNQVISFENKIENGLGIPLPSGNVRFYGKDLTDNSISFIGSNNIKDVPKNEKVEISIGENFDSVLETKLIDKNDNKYIIEYEVRNNSNEKQTYTIKQNAYSFDYKKYNTKVYFDSNECNNNKCNIKETSFNNLEYEINLNPNEKINFKTTFSNYEIFKTK